MKNNKNYILGYGERLTEPIPGPKIDPKKQHPYTFDEAIDRLTPQIKSVAKQLDALPSVACPNDESVAIMTLHPAYIAKSYFPEYLLRSFGLRSVGSKPSFIKPQKSQKKGKIISEPTVDLFIAGKRENFHKLSKNLGDLKQDKNLMDQIVRFEKIRCFSPGERIKKIEETSKSLIALETVLHINESFGEGYILDGYNKYLKSLDVELDLNRRFITRGLCFIPAKAPKENIPQIEKFSFLRVARKMPKIRIFNPVLRQLPSVKSFKCKLPEEGPVDPDTEIYVFDGGVPNHEKMKPWLSGLKTKGIGNAVPEFKEHGFSVSSALLFGPILKGQPLSRPYAKVKHYRVLDDSTDEGSDLYDVLSRITDILHNRKPEFINLSIGPALPIEDDDIHVWTAVLDEYFGENKILATVAVGNDGDLDEDSGNSRIQVPSDCVNCFAVGASDSLDKKMWRRASYSSIGPGRSPGRVKPDAIAFGGSEREPYYILDPSTLNIAKPTAGTSFSAPTVLRLASGIRAHFGNHLTPLSIKALLLHCCKNNEEDTKNIGWGLIPHDLSDIMECGKGEVRIVYQGTLEPSKYIRAIIPMPAEPISNMITLSATFCFNTDTDPQDPSNYTRSGLEIQFRPNANKFKGKDVLRPATKSFFNAKHLYATENELRTDAHKWETVLHNSARFRGSSLTDPTFDIHYNARETGGISRSAKPIPYSLVISISSPKTTELYDQILNRFRTELEVLEPKIELPIIASVNNI
ncbi:MAG: S8 family peptidase [Proteobacteria bacterium]|nr:S8 family peptidase [Pseudomonadota bacterium]